MIPESKHRDRKIVMKVVCILYKLGLANIKSVNDISKAMRARRTREVK